MSTIQKLENLKNKIINKLVTVKSVEETKNKEMLKGGFLKQFFKYVFLKPVLFKKISSNVDEFFTDDKGLNYYKLINLIAFLVMGAIGIVGSLFEKSINPIFIFITGFFILITLIMIPSGADWVDKNKETKKKFNVSNIEDIKKNLLENYTDPQIRSLLKKTLDKDDLINIMVELEKMIGKDEILSCFEKVIKINNDEEIFKDISNPYVLVKLIERLILNEKQSEKEKEEDLNKKEIRKFNNGIIDSLINNGNKYNSKEIENYNKEKSPEILKV